MVSIIYVVLFINLQLTKATTLSQTHPSYVPVCPGDTVTFTCTTTTTGNPGYAYWSLDRMSFSRFKSSSNIGDTIQLNPFTLTLTNISDSSNEKLVVSTAAVVNVDYSLNGTSVYCSNTNTNYDNMSTLIVTDTTLPPIGLSVTALSDSSVNLTWSPPSLDSIHCITGYIIISRDDGIPVVMTTTSTNTLVLSHGLSYGNTYNFTVAAVDKTNTTGSYSQHVIINLSVPNVVRNLNYTSSPGDGTITVYWSSPVNDYHPDIIRYIIRYTNMTDDTSHDVTNYTLRGVSEGSTYSISVSAVNIIGEGTNDTIYVLVVSPSPPSSVSQSSFLTNTLYTTSTTHSIINPMDTMTSTSVTSIVTVSSSSSSSMSSTTVLPLPSVDIGTIEGAIGGGVGFVVALLIIIIIVSILLSVCYIKKTKTNKSVQLDTPQQDHLMETFTSPNSPPLPPQEQPTALYAQVNRNTPPVTRSGGDHHQRYNDAESTGQYPLISSSDDNDNPPPLPPPFNPMEASEYSVLRREDKEKQRIDDMRGANMGGPLYSTLNQERVEPVVIPAKPKGLVYAEVGNFTGRRANVPPPMEGTQSVIYSQVQQTPLIPKRTKTDQILAQIGDIEIPPPRPPKPSPRGPINNL